MSEDADDYYGFIGKAMATGMTLFETTERARAKVSKSRVGILEMEKHGSTGTETACTLKNTRIDTSSLESPSVVCMKPGTL